MKLFRILSIPTDNIAHKKYTKNICMYLILLHIILIINVIVYNTLQLHMLSQLSIIFLVAFIIFDVISIIFCNDLVRCEEIQSILFLIVSNINFLLLGGFYMNTATQLLGILVPLGTMGIYDTRKKYVNIKGKIYLILSITPFIFSYIFYDWINTRIMTPLHIVDNADVESLLNVINIVIFSSSIFILLYLISNKNRKLEQLAMLLIMDIMPKPIADKILINDETISSNYFPETTLLVADIVNFTYMSSKVNPLQLIDNLNNLFSRFDDLTAKYNLEKIKTIGDAYVVANGMYSDHNPQKIVDFAIELLQLNQSIHFIYDYPCEIRISIQTESCYGGILGKKHFYDIWGNAIHFAHILSSSTEKNTILLSENTYQHISHSYTSAQLIPKKIIDEKNNIDTQAYEINITDK